jgi:hypothetical protein
MTLKTNKNKGVSLTDNFKAIKNLTVLQEGKIDSLKMYDMTGVFYSLQ